MSGDNRPPSGRPVPTTIPTSRAAVRLAWRFEVQHGAAVGAAPPHRPPPVSDGPGRRRGASPRHWMAGRRGGLTDGTVRIEPIGQTR